MVSRDSFQCNQGHLSNQLVWKGQVSGFCTFPKGYLRKWCKSLLVYLGVDQDDIATGNESQRTVECI